MLKRNRIRRPLFFLPAVLFFAAGSIARAESGGGGKNRGFSLSGTGMFMTSSTQQGGQGPQGSTLLSQFDALYHWRALAFGVAFQFDVQGSAEKDYSVGPKAELRISHFYLDAGYLPSVYKGYTDRSIASQTGTAFYVGIGARYDLFNKGGKDKGVFFEASFKYRIQQLTKQDSVTLTQTITETDLYPLLGFGYQF